MKLIDLLVRELPRHGGWPEGADAVWQNSRGYLVRQVFRSGCTDAEINIGFDSLAEDMNTGVTRVQYEAALAAPKQAEWNGFGVPPVGQKCKRSAFGADWAECEVLYVGPEVIVLSVEGSEKAYKTGNVKFHPLLTEAERKRDEAIAAMRNLATNYNNTAVIHAIEQVYDSIAAGKIPHITLK